MDLIRGHNRHTHAQTHAQVQTREYQLRNLGAHSGQLAQLISNFGKLVCHLPLQLLSRAARAPAGAPVGAIITNSHLCILILSWSRPTFAAFKLDSMVFVRLDPLEDHRASSSQLAASARTEAALGAPARRFRLDAGGAIIVRR